MYKFTVDGKASPSASGNEQDVTLTMTLDQFDRVRQGLTVEGMPCAITSGVVMVNVTVTLPHYSRRLDPYYAQRMGVEVSGEPPVWPLP